MEPSHTSKYEMDYYGTSKIDFMFWKGRWGMCSWRNVMMGRLRAMMVQSAPQHFLRNPTIGPTWKTMQRSMWRLAWHANKIRHSTRSKRACYNLCQFLKGCEKVCPWVSWYVYPHQGASMPSWWWWIDLARWHISFPPRIMPRPKRREGCSSPTCSSIMASQRT